MGVRVCLSISLPRAGTCTLLPRKYSTCRNLYTSTAKLFHVPEPVHFYRESIPRAGTCTLLPRNSSTCRNLYNSTAKVFHVPEPVHFYRESLPRAGTCTILPRKYSTCGALRCRMRAVLNMFRASLCLSSGEQRPCVTAYSVLC